GIDKGSVVLRGEARVSVGLGESLRPERKSDSTTEEGPGQEPRRAGALVREAGRAFQTDGTDRQRQDGVRASGDEAMRELQSATERETLAQSPAVVAEEGGLAIGKALRSQPLTPKAERVGKIGQPLLQQPAVDHVGARVDGLPAEGIAQDVVHTAAARGDWQVADLERSGLDAFAANQHAIHVDFEGGGSLGRAGQAR